MTNPNAASAPLPMPGARITSPAGWRQRGGGRREWHEGADLRAGVGTPVLAVRAGVVHGAMPEGTRGLRGYGHLVVVWHPRDGVYTAYAHLSEMFVSRGDPVVAGTVIAASGATSGGRHLGMGPHLHFAVRRPRSDGLAPWPGAYPHPVRAPWAHRAYWVDPVDFLRGFGLEPATRRGAGELRIRPASAADAGGGRAHPSLRPQRAPLVRAGGHVPAHAAAPTRSERPLHVAPPGSTPRAAAPGSTPRAAAPLSASSTAAVPPPCSTGMLFWPWALLASFGVALASVRGRSK